ncbi:non-ribosomal peptide synthetase/type I polyketide synthase [Brevibacillus parabrevis]|uniref:non-ribosomal peptide synthetase/type I polyketide synthase n=1 Tax=Brevibacillus parabrevis TaxID=54914 RepID=UPI002E1E6DCD|nr:non-ribosomal peptide synthetase/type I polyketide synthase [Brevibacillus parabrevis]MED1721282.1 amino acid adenylation domain-containing protein [Brevibacillus parabrevis]
MKKLDANQVSDIISLSPMQEGMLFHYLKEPDSSLYFEQISLHVSSAVHIAAFQQAWRHVVSVNEMLRAVFRWEGVKAPLLIILKELPDFLRYVDVSAQMTADRDTFVANLLDEDRANKFDLREGAFRVSLYKLGDEDYQLILSHHHILFDGWSTGILLAEFMETYQQLLEQRQPTVAAKRKFKDFIKSVQQKDKAEQETFWKTYLNEVNPLWLQEIIPANQSRASKHAVEKKQARLDIPQSLHAEIKRQGKHAISCYLYGAWALLHYFYADSKDVVFGTTVSGREESLDGIDKMVGLFINTLPLRLAIDPDESLQAFLERVFASMNARKHYSSTPLRDIKKYSGLPFEKELFDTVLVIENYPLQPHSKNRNFVIDSFSYREETNYPLTIFITLWETIELVVDYDCRVYSEAFVQELCARYKMILTYFVEQPLETIRTVDFLFPEEKQKLLGEWVNTKVALPTGKTIHQLFEEQVNKTPERIALTCEGRSFTYRQMNEQANQLANLLQDAGVQPNQVVGLFMDRRPELVIALLGILKSGGAYLPLEPTLPLERCAMMLSGACANVVVSVQKFTDVLAGLKTKCPLLQTVVCMDQAESEAEYSLRDLQQYEREVAVTAPQATSDDLAYVIYTSGSTGVPKGVMISHENVVNFLYAMEREIGFEPEHTVLALAAYSFDIFVLESLAPLCWGMKMTLASDAVLKDPDEIMKLIEAESVTILQATPSRMKLLVQSARASSLQQLQKILIGGEALSEDLYKSLRAITEQPIYNVYGPTETTVWSTIQRLEETISVGKPIANVGIYLLSNERTLRPPGYPGEVCIFGKGLGKGYLNQPLLTAEKFIANPFQPGERLYCTGDYAYWLPDGSLQFVGRKDDQVKIRGHRIELAEVESALKDFSPVKDVIVTETKEKNESALAAYLVVDSGFNWTACKAFLKTKLPHYAIPSACYRIPEIPYTSNLKVDRKALVQMQKEPLHLLEHTTEPKSKLEAKIAETWKNVLEIERVGIHDRFFDVGGDSINIIRLCNELKAEMNTDVPVQTIFTYPTIHELANYFHAKATGESRTAKPSAEKPKAAKPRTVDIQDTDVAIIGMAGRFPGAADKEQFWRNLVSGNEAIKFYSDEEMEALGIDRELWNNPHYVKAKGKLDDIDCFDAEFFGYTVAEAEWMDPQIRLLHECAWHALEDAGYEPEAYPGSIGLYVGSAYNIYWVPETFSPSLYASEQYQIYHVNSNSFATLIAYRMNLRGPAITVQAACSTSLVAVDRAYKDLLFGDCDIAVAGAAAVTLLDEAGYIHQEGMVLSKDGHCRAFDKKATGTVTGNGVGLVVLKRLKDALADGDHIYSVLKSTAVNNDGNRKVGYSAPSAEGQAAVIQKAIERSGIEAAQIHYVEAHGTGTALGDPVEVEGLKLAFDTDKKNYCGIGSVKTNIGHLEAAAGIAGLMKTSLSLKNRMIPPTINCEEVNGQIDFENSPFYLNTQLLDLQTEDIFPLRAGVSSFGQGGSNAHVILEEAPPAIETPAKRRYQMIALSAHSEAALKEMKGRIRETFKRDDSIQLADAAYTLKVGRKRFSHRSVLLCAEVREAIEVLTEKNSRKSWDFVASEQSPALVFMFSGQGAEYVNMALDLYRHEPLFREKLDECFAILQNISGVRYPDYLYPDQPDDQIAREIHRQSVSQPLHFAIEYSLAWMLMEWGAAPSNMIGYSIGEYVAACIAGVFSLEDALILTYHRGRLMEKLPEGVMLTVPLAEEALLSILPQELSIAAVNEESCIVAGSKEDIARFEAVLKEQKVISMRLAISHAGHSNMLDSMLSEFGEYVQRVSFQPPVLPFVSSLTGNPITPEEAVDPGYWVRHLREPVRFVAGLQKLAQQEHTLFIEIGPGRNLCMLAQRFLRPERNQKLLDTIRVERKQVADDEQLLKTVAQMWLYGVDLDWKRFYDGERRRRISLPGYPFAKKRYWNHAFRFDTSQFGKRTGGKRLASAALQSAALLSFSPAHSQERLSGQVAESVPVAHTFTSEEGSVISRLVGEIIGGPNVGEDEDLFEAGFDSLKVVSFISKLVDAFQVQLTMHEVFAHPTIRELVPLIRQKAPQAAVVIPKAAEAPYYPASSQQKRLYALQQFDETSTAYNIPGVFLLHGTVDRERMQAACEGVLQRHEALRTYFELDGQELVQKIVAVASSFALEWREMPGASVEEALEGFIRPFSLHEAPLLRIRLVSIAPDRHVMLIDMHHIISDGLSIERLVSDFLAYYDGQTLAEPKRQYKDFAVWQQSRDEADWQKEADFWLQQYRDGYETLDLPTDYRRPPIKHFAGDLRRFVWTDEQAAVLREFCRAQQLTPYMLLFGCFSILLAKYSGQQAIMVGTPVGGRIGAETEETVGAFVNTLALRSYPAGEKRVVDYLQELKAYCLQAFEHQTYPFEELVQQVEKERDLSRNPLFDTMFAWEQRDRSQLRIRGLDVQRQDIHSGIAKFDLMLQAWEEQGQMGFALEYATALFAASTVERMGKHYTQILQEILQAPEQPIKEIRLISAKEEQLLRDGFNQTQVDEDWSQSVVALIEAQVSKRGDEQAVVCEGQSLTYRELNERANQVARFLLDHGCEKNQIVGIVAERSLAMIIGLLAIEKAGGAYLPIDPATPAERIQYLLEDSGARLVLTQTKLIEQMTFTDSAEIAVYDLEDEAQYASYERTNPGVPLLPDDLAYVLYTSGSTGQPKGVMLTHGGMANRLCWMAAHYGMDEQEVVLQKTTYTFDVSVWELFLPLMIGGVLCFAKPGGEKDPEYLYRLIDEQQITTLHFVPSMLAAFLHALPDNADEASFSRLKRCICSGEELSIEVKDRFFRKMPEVELHNLYGPTEASIDVTFYEVQAEDRLIPIGKPVANTRLYIVTEEGGLAPIGVPGELCIAGIQLAKGYLNRPELTAEKFRELPLLPGERLYFTGDLARWLEDGNIAYLGRKDTQIKLRGFRIELGEIESAIQSYTDKIETVAVVSQGTQAESKVLCAFFSATEKVDVGKLKAHLQRHLPAYMVPLHYQQLAALPHTSSGKIDRKALPRITASDDVDMAASEMLAGEDGQLLASIFKETLGIENISSGAHFFELGGNSLAAIVLKAKISAAFQVQLTMQEVFAHPTIRELVPLIRQKAPQAAVVIPKAAEAPYYPVSSQQKRLYALQQFDETSTAYNIPGVFLLHGAVDRERMQAACEGVLQRHEALRTYFELNGQELVQKIVAAAPSGLAVLGTPAVPSALAAPSASAVSGASATPSGSAALTTSATPPFALEWREMPGASVEEALEGFIRPFSLHEAPLLRIRLVSIAPDRHVMLIDMHHIISDGLSIERLVSDFLAYYDGQSLAEPKRQYKDFAVWQQSRDASDWQKEADFWLQQYRDGYETLDLPTDYRRPPIKHFAGDLRRFVWTDEQAAALREFCRAQQLTPYMLLLGCFSILLAKYSGQQAIMVGTPVGGRIGAETEETVGAFVNTLALRSYPAGEKRVVDYLQELKAYCLQAFEHQTYPFEELVQQVEKERDLSRNPLFDTMFAWEQRDRSQLRIRGLDVQRQDIHSGIAKFDLMLQAWEEQGQMGFALEYATALFAATTVERMGKHYTQILQEILQAPEQPIKEIRLISAEEEQLLRDGFNQTRVDEDWSRSVVALIEEQVSKRGDEQAVICEGQSLTYRELNERANQVARFLLEQGCEKNEIVGIMAERSLAMIIGLLAIEKAGAAYLPIDPATPAERIQYLLEDSGARLVLTQTKLIEQMTFTDTAEIAVHDLEDEAQYASYERTNPGVPLLPDDLAYVLHTSGSTGQPKGVMLTHGGMSNRLCWMAAHYGMDEQEVVLQKTTYTFDVSVWELFLPLMIGGVLYFAKPGGEKDPEYLYRLIDEQQITTLHFVPSMLAAFLHALPDNADEASFSRLKRCICSGEELSVEVKDRFFRKMPEVELHNLYGPTEASIDVTFYEVQAEDRLIPIGKPVANTRLYIVTEEGGLAPIGVPGELCIAGIQLAKGYLNRPELTAEKFRELPLLPGERLYFTGDLARWLEDGNIAYLGRKDTQIKLRGFRIELGEIESAIQSYTDKIETVAVVSQGTQAESKMLCAYYSATEQIDSGQLQAYLQRHLPVYMVPLHYQQLAALPHTSSGKVDRKALSRMPLNVEKERAVLPKTEQEKQLSLIWKEVLQIEKVGIRDDFFQLGGNSLSVIHLHKRLTEQLDPTISIANLYRYRTIESFLAYTSQKAHAGKSQTVTVPERKERLLQGNAKRSQRLSKRKGTNSDE